MIVRNNSIDILSYIFSVLVVGIHLDLFNDITPILNFLFRYPLGSLAVPFFFVISGYYSNLEVNTKPKILYLLKKYIFHFFLYLPLYIYIDSPKWNLETIITTILFDGSFYHLWFLPALIFSIVFTNITQNKCLKLALPILSICGIILSSYTFIVKDVIQINHALLVILRFVFTSLPFYLFGIYCKNKNSKTCYKLLPPIFLIYICEFFIVIRYQLGLNYTTLFSMYPLIFSLIQLCEKFPLHSLPTIGKNCRKLSELTYYFHPLLISILFTLNYHLGLNINTFVYLLLTIFTIYIFFLFFKKIRCIIKQDKNLTCK